MAEIESYESAFKELQKILEELESESVSMDDLSKKVERASKLLTYCQNKLRSTEEQVKKIIEDSES